MEDVLCDFCNQATTTDTDGERTHYAKPFDINFVINGFPCPVHFTEAWLACDRCHQLLKDGDREKLLAVSLENAVDKVSVIIIQEMFWRNKI